MRTIRIGSGAGYSGDRIEPAVELAEKGEIQYLVFECLGERTVALAQQARMKNPESGYDPLLEERMRAVLPLCAAKNIKIVTNMGAANPAAAARIEDLYGTFAVLREKRRAPASSLSGGQRKMLGIAKALAAEPLLLVMDEPSAGLSPLFVKEVIRILSDLRGRGLALLIAEQNIGFLEVATRVFVLEGGRIRFSGTVTEMTDNEALRRAYFGLK